MKQRLPKFIVLSLYPENGICNFICYTKQSDEVRLQENDVFSPLTKIRVEPAKGNRNYVHLSFCHDNKYKYWTQREDHYIVASSDQPEESISNSSSTLFKPTFLYNDNVISLTHVQSEVKVCFNLDDKNESMRSALLATDSHDLPGHFGMFKIVDCDSLVKLPKHVTFKGSNGKYLKFCDSTSCLEFSSEYDNDKASSYEIHPCPDGHVRILSKPFEQFWTCKSDQSILADLYSRNDPEADTLFWPVKVDDHTIALRFSYVGVDAFCSRSSSTNCLMADAPTVTTDARLVLEELVWERNVYDVRFFNEDARIYEKTILVGSGTAENNTDLESTFTIKVSYEDIHTYSFSNSFSISTKGIKTTFETGIPRIVEGREIKIPAEVTNSVEWGKPVEEKKIVEVTYTIAVPSWSEATVKCVATQGRCIIPFSYTQRDKRSTDGELLTYDHIDGTFDGTNNYDFRFELLKIQPSDEEAES